MSDDVQSGTIAQLRARILALESDLAQQRPQSITTFSFIDDGPKCKLYVELGSEVLGKKASDDDSMSSAEAAASVAFLRRTCELHVYCPSASGEIARHYTAAFALESDIVPDKCAWRVDRSSGRVTIVLMKKDGERVWSRITPQDMGRAAPNGDELNVTVHLDRRLGLRVSKTITKGTTVGSLKRVLAQEDPKGRSEIGLMLTRSGQLLPDTAVLEEEVMELDVCTPDVMAQPD
uniref:Uncharacterized protein n=1 Tax=Pyrodinium bahamense TaxID=73915 RepID=A0A7S0ATN5_9DINO|mmetsp:Transcript_42110/g.117252  ORF Transcript_42110/g.117252 Transcript_42110/m.117252 type:complete len:234 (+) Transcript_42110:73-774(+)